LYFKKEKQKTNKKVHILTKETEKKPGGGKPSFFSSRSKKL
jgi:hypothetical protein